MRPTHPAIFRAGMEILPTADTMVELGDTVRIVGKRELLEDIRNELGNSVKELVHPNTLPIFSASSSASCSAASPPRFPGLPVPAKLGMAGGPLLVAILLGYKGRIGGYDFYMTPGANTMLRELGIILFLACVGLSSGAQFVDTFNQGGYCGCSMVPQSPSSRSWWPQSSRVFSRLTISRSAGHLWRHDRSASTRVRQRPGTDTSPGDGVCYGLSMTVTSCASSSPRFSS